MDYACPNCGCSLKREKPKVVPLPGQRRFLPMKTGLACPQCDAWLEFNVHPIEKRARFIDLVVFCALILYASQSNLFGFPFAAALLWGGLTELGLAFWSRRHLCSWSRYAIAKNS